MKTTITHDNMEHLVTRLSEMRGWYGREEYRELARPVTQRYNTGKSDVFVNGISYLLDAMDTAPSLDDAFSEIANHFIEKHREARVKCDKAIVANNSEEARKLGDEYNAVSTFLFEFQRQSRDFSPREDNAKMLAEMSL